MAITKKARENHDALFPNYKSTLKNTDPELIEVFDNFAFDEVASHGKLDQKTKLMAVLACLIASQTISEYKIMVSGALDNGVSPIEVKEIVYQCVPYLGIAKVLDFLHATNEELTNRGIPLPLSEQSTTTRETRFDKGAKTRISIFGGTVEEIFEGAIEDERHIQSYLCANCFGDYYTRKGLSLKVRELLTFCILASLGGCEPQLKSHIGGNLAVGNTREALLDTVTNLLPYLGYPRTLNAIRCIDEVSPKEAGGE